MLWKAFGMMNQGCVLTLTGKASHAVQMMTSGITAINGINNADAVVLSTFGEGLC